MLALTAPLRRRNRLTVEGVIGRRGEPAARKTAGAPAPTWFFHSARLGGLRFIEFSINLGSSFVDHSRSDDRSLSSHFIYTLLYKVTVLGSNKKLN